MSGSVFADEVTLFILCWTTKTLRTARNSVLQIYYVTTALLHPPCFLEPGETKMTNKL